MQVSNSETAAVLRTVTFKYFEPGHGFNSCDSHHHLLENQFKKKNFMYDFSDYVDCMEAAGSCIQMQACDFRNWEKGLSESKLSKSTRPLLADVVEVQFRAGECVMYFKTSDYSNPYKCAQFLTKRAREEVAMLPRTKVGKGIPADRLRGIQEKLVPLMPPNRHRFWGSLKSYKN